MSRIISHIIIFTACIFSCFFCFAQTGISVKAAINRDKIIIGEPVELKLEANVPAGTDAKWFPLDSLTHFEMIDKGKIDTSGTADTRTYRQTLVITSFDSGRWALPALALSVGNREYLTDSLPVSVAYANFDPNQEYHDIKEILEVTNSAVQYINWILLGVALLALCAVVYFLLKKAGKPVVAVVKKPAPLLSALDEAMQSLEKIKQLGYATPETVKAFHTGLNDTLRQYLYRKTSVATMEKTSSELMLQLQAIQLPAADFTRLAQVLRMNDAVKFAKYRPSAEENETAFEIINQSIQQAEAIFIKQTK